MEVNLSKFLDMEIMIKNGIIKIPAVVKESNILNRWYSTVPKNYKQNAIHRFKISIPYRKFHDFY